MTAWSRAPERGATWLVHLMLWLMQHVGWFARSIVLPGITAWFYVTSPSARTASREYLRTVLDRRVTGRDVLRHIHVFASTILDRAALLTSESHGIALDVSGLEHVEAAIGGGRGCLLLGSHLGSFAMLRGLAERCPVPVKMLMYRANAGTYSTMMEQLDPSSARQVIPIGEVQSMLQIHDAVAQGAIVAILADRVPSGGGRVVTVPFFGRPAPFPAGPFILGASLGVPTLMFRGVRTSPRRYDIAFQPLAERIVLSRVTREADLVAIVSRYAAWLEQACRAHPFNWFNFFSFWERAEHVPTKARPMVAAASRPAGRPVLGTEPGPATG